jgi:hypothetical protein
MRHIQWLKATLIALSISLMAPISAQVPAQVPPGAPSQPTPETLRPSVLVEGQEPKYVAPNTLDQIGRIWAPVKINGKGPFRLVLDTSGNSSAVTQAVADQLGIPIQESNKAKLIGVTGTAVVSVVRVESMEVGEISVGGGMLAIVPDAFGDAEGVLTPKGFGDKRVVIDFRNDMIRISRSPGAAVESGFTRIPVSTDRRQLLMFDIRVGGVKTKAILSTAGQRTIGNSALREALLKRAREGKEQDIIGVTLDIEKGQTIAVPPVAVGELTFRNLNITFADASIFDQWKLSREPAMMIGMDVIGSLDTLIIDYKMQELHLRARR